MPHPWHNMLNLQRSVGCATIGAAPPPLLEQILLDLVPCQSPLLILHPTELGVLHELSIELDEFQADSADGTPTSQPLHPGEHIGETTLQRGGNQPSRRLRLAKRAGR